MKRTAYLLLAAACLALLLSSCAYQRGVMVNRSSAEVYVKFDSWWKPLELLPGEVSKTFTMTPGVHYAIVEAFFPDATAVGYQQVISHAPVRWHVDRRRGDKELDGRWYDFVMTVNNELLGQHIYFGPPAPGESLLPEHPVRR